jgi:ATP-dependent DNA ligase
MHPAIAASGLRSNASTVKNSSYLAGPTPTARSRRSALLLAYYDPDDRLVYAGRVGSGINRAELARLWHRLQLLAVSNRFDSPLVLNRVHWVRPELVAANS